MVVLSTKERPTDQAKVKPITCQRVRSIFWVDWRKERDFCWVFIGRTFYYMSVAQQTFLYYFIRDMLLVESEAEIRWRLAVLVIIAMLCAICVALPLGRYSEVVGRMPLIYAS